MNKKKKTGKILLFVLIIEMIVAVYTYYRKPEYILLPMFALFATAIAAMMMGADRR